jgi:hypothetical protein
VGGDKVTEHDWPELAAQELEWAPSPTLDPNAVPVGDGDWVPLTPVIDFLAEHGNPVGVTQGAARALFKPAKRGELRLEGSETKCGNPSIAIPPSYFRNARIARGDTVAIDYDAVSSGEEFVDLRLAGHKPWHHVHVYRPDLVTWLLTLLPQPDLKPVAADLKAAQLPDPPRRASLKLDLENAYKAWVAEYPDPPYPNEKADCLHMQALFTINRDRVRELRRDFSPEEWKKTGRRRKVV